MIAKKNSAQHEPTQTNESKDKPKNKREVLPYMQNRELSWLNFNKRVLDQGEDRNVPLLERLTFVSIFSSNLQEFFMVRVGSLTDLALVKKELLDNKTLMTPHEQLEAIYNRCHELYPEQERTYKNILGQLEEYDIKQKTLQTINDEQREYLRLYLQSSVMPYLSPQVINARHPFPHLENGALYVLLRLDEEERRAKSKDSDEGKNKKKTKNVGADDATFGLIPLPRQAKRVIALPGDGTQFILLEEALKLIVDEVFSMYVTKRASVICVTRNADIDANEGVDEIDYDYREHMKRILKKRARLAPVRLETDTPLSTVTEKFLLKYLNLTPNQVFVTSVPLDMGYAWGLPSLVDEEIAHELTNEPFTPSWPACLDRRRSIIEQVCESDKLLSYPYESMDPFIQMLREASTDPSVISIKITLYRLASQSHLAEALLAAAENGKEVTALFELRARFDESNNIDWSQRFEQAGANVIYGFHDFKVHSKICVITRNTDKGLQHITQLGTGNYNEKTSKLYTDFSYITTDEAIGRDAAEFFRNMNLENTSNNYQVLSVAPLQIKPMILDKIDEQIALAKAGKPNGLLFKTNSITDKAIIDKIAEASQAGVKTILFVRGISCIIPMVDGYTDNVEVVSIVGRLLEHSRIYGFGTFDEMELYLSSADLMTRNMDKRIEIAWPIRSKDLKQIILDYLQACLSDTAKLRMLQANLEYTPLEFFADEDDESGKVDSFDSQAYLIKKAADDYQEAVLEREEREAQRSAMARAQKIRDIDSMQHNPQVTPIPPAVPVIEHPALEPTPAQEMAEEEAVHAIDRKDMAETMAEAPIDETPSQDSTTVRVEEAQEALHNLDAQEDSIPTPSVATLDVEEAPLPEQPQRVQATVIETEEEKAQKAVQEQARQAQEAALQVLPPTFPKTTFMQRLKFLFTGHF